MGRTIVGITSIILACFVCVTDGIGESVNINRIDYKYDDRYHLDFEEKLRWQIERFQRLNLDQLIDALEVLPGMTILDIGTGQGLYAFKFAEKLAGTGKVFATDVDGQSIDYVTQMAKEKGMKNIFPVLVNKEGLDPFYKVNRYDIILLVHTYRYINNRVAYFKELGNQLVQHGRVVVMDTYVLDVLLKNSDIHDVQGLIKALSHEPASSPFRKGLKASTREMIHHHRKNDPVEPILEAIVFDLNQMAYSRELLNYYVKARKLDEGVVFTPQEQEYVDYLLKTLPEDISQRPSDDLYRKEQGMVTQLTKFLIIQKFRRYLRDGDHFFNPPDSFYVQHYVNREMSEAGYTLEKVYDFLGLFEVALVFRK